MGCARCRRGPHGSEPSGARVAPRCWGWEPHLGEGYPQHVGQVDELHVKAPALQPLVAVENRRRAPREELRHVGSAAGAKASGSRRSDTWARAPNEAHARPHTLKPHCVSRMRAPATNVTKKWKPCASSTCTLHLVTCCNPRSRGGRATRTPPRPARTLVSRLRMPLRLAAAACDRCARLPSAAARGASSLLLPDGLTILRSGSNKAGGRGRAIGLGNCALARQRCEPSQSQ